MSDVKITHAVDELIAKAVQSKAQFTEDTPAPVSCSDAEGNVIDDRQDTPQGTRKRKLPVRKSRDVFGR